MNIAGDVPVDRSPQKSDLSEPLVRQGVVDRLDLGQDFVGEVRELTSEFLVVAFGRCLVELAQVLLCGADGRSEEAGGVGGATDDPGILLDVVPMGENSLQSFPLVAQRAELPLEDELVDRNDDDEGSEQPLDDPDVRVRQWGPSRRNCWTDTGPNSPTVTVAA